MLRNDVAVGGGVPVLLKRYEKKIYLTAASCPPHSLALWLKGGIHIEYELDNYFLIWLLKLFKATP